MIVKNISLEGYRNYVNQSVSFSDSVNVIVGDNAQGKTNLLEAIYYLTSGRSFRTRFDKEVIGFSAEMALIEAEIHSGDRLQKLSAKIPKQGRKQLFAGGHRLKTAAELSGKLTAVLFCPADLTIVRSGSAQRRKLMNLCISQLRPKYANALLGFNKAHEHKTKILKDRFEMPSLLSVLDEFSYEMAKYSAELIYYRAHFVKKLSEAAGEIYREFTGGKETLSLSYKTIKTIPDPMKKPQELLPYILEHQESHKDAELGASLCLTGAHKDDIEILIDGVDAKSFASQGQTRTAVLSMKLAERQIHYDDRGEYPLLLLDDVLSELDSKRQDFILNRIHDGQVFITCCEDGVTSQKTGGKLLSVSKGEITPCTSI